MMLKVRKIRATAIKKQKILDWKSRPEACLYRITNLDTGEIYLGVHLYKKNEFPGDGKYWHSSKNKKFKRICSNPKSNLQYETVEYGDYATMTVREHEKLTEVDAVNNPMYYNDSNGAPAFKTVDYKKVKKLADLILPYSKETYGDLIKKNLIKKCPFSIRLENKELIYNLTGIQAKAEMDDSIIQHIMVSTDKKMGDVSDCKPVSIICEEVYNGHHTKDGVYNAKHTTDVPTMRIDEQYIDGWSEAEKRLLANLLNPKSKIREKEMAEKDAVKLITGYGINDKIPADFAGNYQILEEVGFNDKEVNRIINKARKDIQRNNYSANETHIHWKAEGWSTQLENIRKSLAKFYGDQNAIVTYQSTDALDMKALEKVHDSRFSLEKKSFLQEIDNPPEKLIVLAHAPTPESKNEFYNGEGDKYKNKLRLFCEKIGVKVIVLLMPPTRPDTNVNPGDFWKTQQAKNWIADNNLENVLNTI